MSKKVCGIVHALGGQTCAREHGHDGPCRCRAERGRTGTITYSEWFSKGGKFHRHIGYKTIYVKNARKS